MNTLTDEVVDLEELFQLDIPCGGNLYPITRPCPDHAEADFVGTHMCLSRPQDFKCASCHADWLQAVLDDGEGDLVFCDVCDDEWPASEAYRPL